MRKVVGDCYNNIVECKHDTWAPSVALRAGAGTERCLTQPWLFGVASKWFLDKSDKLDFMNAFLTNAQRDNNQHLFPQNCFQQFFLQNPLDYRQKVEIYKMTIKCNKGQASGAYVSPVTSTQAGPDPTTDVELAATLWDQSMRDVANTAIVPASSYNVTLATNGLGIAANIPVAGALDNPWELIQTAYPYRDLGCAPFRYRLGWIFPKLQSSVKVTKVFSKWIKARGTASFKVKEHWPKEIRPLDLLDRFVPTLSKGQSFFYFVRIRTAPMAHGNFQTENMANVFVPANTIGAIMKRLPVSICVRWERHWGTRNAGDHVPNYLVGTTLTSRWAINRTDTGLQNVGTAGMTIPVPYNTRMPAFGNSIAP